MENFVIVSKRRELQKYIDNFFSVLRAYPLYKEESSLDLILSSVFEPFSFPNAPYTQVGHAIRQYYEFSVPIILGYVEETLGLNELYMEYVGVVIPVKNIGLASYAFYHLLDTASKLEGSFGYKFTNERIKNAYEEFLNAKNKILERSYPGFVYEN